MMHVGMPRGSVRIPTDGCCEIECGARCRCAEQYAVKWTGRALIFCTLIAAFVWGAPWLLEIMAR